MRRRVSLSTGEYYHVYTRSISGYVVFNHPDEYLRMMNLLRFYQLKKAPVSYTQFLKNELVDDHDFCQRFNESHKGKERLVEIVAYCLMPTHIHLVLKQAVDSGIMNFMRNVLNSYSKYFNIKHERKGPLWEGRFKNVQVNQDDQMLHLTRYLHLNPSTAYLVNDPRDWKYSSLMEYLGEVSESERISDFNSVVDLSSGDYLRFVMERVSDQRELSSLKSEIS